MQPPRYCQRCGACWLHRDDAWHHHWRNQIRPGNELDLAGLVCNVVNDPACINPAKGRTGGQAFASRMAMTLADCQEKRGPKPPLDP